MLSSIGLVIDLAKAPMWRRPMLSKAIKQLKNSTHCGNLDYLFVDMPPGTGDAYLTVASDIEPDYAILITSMSKLAVHDTKKSKTMFNRLEMPVLGIIDNMSYSICPNTHEHINDLMLVNLEQEIGCELLGSIHRHKE